jgi:glycosyltransferase involved in cell wall biosynthesis
MNNHKVTCIIPCRNGAATIERAVVSAIKAGCDMVIVYDDASTDGTSEIVPALDDKYYQLCYFAPLSDIRMGVNFARNYMCELADNGLIIPLDADDELYDITPLKEAYEPGTWVYGDHNETIGKEFYGPVKAAPPGSLTRKNITGVTFMFHKDDWQRAGGYDPDFAYAEDYGFQCALTNAGIRPKQVETMVYNRHLKAEGNERSALAGVYWAFYRDMARRKYPSLFANTG